MVKTLQRSRTTDSQNDTERSADSAAALEFEPDLDYTGARAETERIRENMRSEWSNRKIAETSKPTKKAQKTTRKRPLICDCPAAVCLQTRPKRKALTTKSRLKPRVLESATNEDDEIYDGDNDAAVDIASAAAEEDPTPDLAAETSAKACNKCEKLKKAPRGKKIAWRERRNKWMYVHKDAPDEEGPAEEQDDDEPLPGVDSERKTTTATTVEATEIGTTNERLQQSDNADDDIRIANGSDSPGPADTNEPDAGHATVARSSEEGASGTGEISDQQEALSAAQENAEMTNIIPSGREAEATNGTTLEQENHAEGPVITEGSLLNAEMQPQPNAPLVPAGAEVESRKRQNESENEAPASKKARVDVDLTMDDNDAVVVKSEYAEVSGRDLAKRADEDDLQHKLKQLQRRRQILEMQVEEDEIKRKLAKSRTRGGNRGRVKDETITKIED